MKLAIKIGELSRSLAFLAAIAALLFAALYTAAAALPDELASDTVGAIEGEAISVQGPMNVEVVHGQVRTVLRSGSDVRVKSGQARIELVEGGRIAICGPAHFSVLKAGGALTLALDSGTIHAHIERGPALTVYTAQMQAKPFAIGEDAQDTLVGFDGTGAMCIRANSGAVRLEQQLTGQSVIVPQGSDILLSNGQINGLRNVSGHCVCEAELVKTAPPATAAPTAQALNPAAQNEARRLESAARSSAPPSTAAAPESSAPGEEPIYKVFMPPLTYDASAKAQREFDPKLIAVVRSVRVRPTLIFHGTVEGEAVAAANPAEPSGNANPIPQANPMPQKPQAQASSDTMFSRVRAFFHRLWSRTS